MAAVLGAGPVADAFFVAFRLPNHFRAILAEGAFNAAFVPAYARTLATGWHRRRRVLFADRIAAALLASISCCSRSPSSSRLTWSVLLAPGLTDDPDPLRSRRHAHPHHLPLALARLDADHDLGRSSTPMRRFAVAAGVPILLNICMIATLWSPPISSCGQCRRLGRPDCRNRAGAHRRHRRRAARLRT